jgi:hypothetical protein
VPFFPISDFFADEYYSNFAGGLQMRCATAVAFCERFSIARAGIPRCDELK